MDHTYIEEQLKELCTSFIQYMDFLKKEGLITDEEYETHIKVKKQLLDTLYNPTTEIK